MKVCLAGFNVDTSVLRELAKGKELPLTPETISAAYARISRSAKDVTVLRRQACRDVLKARRSNQRIIFSMGHHSIAEHAVFNIDIMKVSRIALEEVERFRLVSYMEKSQRYVMLDGDWVFPSEIEKESERRLFGATVERQNKFYQKAFSVLIRKLGQRYPNLKENSSKEHLLEYMAKEDARYILPLATEGQVGLTINARNLEHLFRHFSLSRYMEVRRLGQKIFALIEKVAPSLILFPKPSVFDREAYPVLQEGMSQFRGAPKIKSEAKIVSATMDGDDVILASFLSSQKGIAFSSALQLIKNLAIKKKKELYLQLFQRMEFFDAPPREFEMVDVVFQALCSASCFAQLKRHRMATLLSGEYDPKWGFTIPENIVSSGLSDEFQEIIDRTDEVYAQLASTYNRGAPYILTNSHRRPVLMKVNLRELFHFIRLRDDLHAQWDIRGLANSLLSQVRRRLPLSTLLLCGKSQFVTEYESLFHSQPKASV